MLKKALLLLLCSLPLHAQDSGFSPGKTVNRWLGDAYHAFKKMIWKKEKLSLAPENEEYIRGIAQEMGLKDDVAMYAYSEKDHKGGPHSFGNSVYFSDEWFNEWADYPEVKRFVIGHELSHVKGYHSQIRAALLGGFAVGSGLLLREVWRTNLPTKGAWLSKGSRLLLGNIALLMYVPLVLKVYRSQEDAADQDALKALGPIYGKETLVNGAATYFSQMSDFKKRSVLKKLFYTHPHSRDRLRKLGLKKEVSKKAALELERLLKERVLIRIEALSGLQYDKDRIKYIISRKDENWYRITVAAALSSVDPAIAQECLEKYTGDMCKNYLYTAYKAVVQKAWSKEVPSEWLRETKKLRSEILHDPEKRDYWLALYEQKFAEENALLKDVLSE